jgi:nucleotide-binding universal stress UspA family protein
VIKSIVVGTDGSPTAECAVDRAGELAKPFGARVHIVSAYDASGVKVGGGGGVAERMVGPGTTVDSVLERAMGMVRVKGVEVETYARKGDAADALLEVADEVDADLILVGNKGMRGAKRLLGSVPNKLTHQATRDVLITHTT